MHHQKTILQLLEYWVYKMVQSSSVVLELADRHGFGMFPGSL